jgi:ketosteroid isomerase-like protein
MAPRFKMALTAVLAAVFAAVGLIASASPGGVEEQIVQMEKDWAEAAMKRDAKPLENIIADDWVGVWWDGSVASKADAIGDIKSGASTIQSITFDPIKVRVFGDTAVAQGGDTEKSQYKGKDSSGHYLWTDVYVKRNGKWQAVASQSTKVEAPAHHH